MSRLGLWVAILLLLTSAALAQSSPGLRYGQVPTAAQWNSYFAAKQDTLSFVPLNPANNLADLSSAAAARANLGLTGVVTLGTGTSVVNPGTGKLEAVQPIKTVATASYAFGVNDLYYLVERSNGGSAMSDTVPGFATTGLVNGTPLQIANVDPTGAITLSASPGTTINGGSSVVIGPGQFTTWVWNADALEWVSTQNTTSALLRASNLSDVASASTSRTNIGAAASGANSDITSLSALSTPLSVTQGGTGASTATAARTSLSAAKSGSNSDITALTGLTTPLSIAQGGTAATTAPAALAALGAFGAIHIQTFTASGTYTPNANLIYAIIDCVGGGGGGGGAIYASNVGNAGAGGGAGAFSEALVTKAMIGASQTVTIGTFGTGGTPSAQGGAGGQTSVGTLCVAPGGQGGLSVSVSANSTPGGAGGAAGTGNLRAVAGQPGEPGNVISSGLGALPGGNGGSGPYGGGGRSSNSNGSPNNGTAGSGFGSGGSGGSANGNAGSNANGANGTAGYVLILEFTSQ